MLKSIALAALIVPAIVFATYAEWQHLGLWNFSDEESKAYIEDLGKRMTSVPDVVGDWEFVTERKIDPGQIQAAKITQYQSRLYRNKSTGAEVSIFLSTGPRGEICIHTPEQCNFNAGDVPVAETQVRDVNQEDESGNDKKSLGSFVWQRFRRPSQNSEFEIWWSFNESGKWEGAKNPRMAFTKPGLYKLYVTNEKMGSGGKNQEPPQLSFLRAFIPELNKSLFPEDKTPDNKVAVK